MLAIPAGAGAGQPARHCARGLHERALRAAGRRAALPRRSGIWRASCGHVWWHIWPEGIWGHARCLMGQWGLPRLVSPVAPPAGCWLAAPPWMQRLLPPAANPVCLPLLSPRSLTHPPAPGVCHHGEPDWPAAGRGLLLNLGAPSESGPACRLASPPARPPACLQPAQAGRRCWLVLVRAPSCGNATTPGGLFALAMTQGRRQMNLVPAPLKESPAASFPFHWCRSPPPPWAKCTRLCCARPGRRWRSRWGGPLLFRGVSWGVSRGQKSLGQKVAVKVWSPLSSSLLKWILGVSQSQYRAAA